MSQAGESSLARFPTQGIVTEIDRDSPGAHTPQGWDARGPPAPARRAGMG